MKNLFIKKKLYVPVLALTLSVGILAACSEQADAAVPNTPIATGTVNAAGAAANIISEADAKKIAFDHVGVKEADAAFLKVKLDYDDNKVEYEVEFYIGNTEYDFDINASTGAIRSFDYEIEEDFNYTISGNNISGNTAGSSQVQGLSEADAKKIALAQVPGASESNIREFEADKDDGRIVYEGEILYNGMEYEFEIDAATGVILDWDADYDD